MDMARPYSGIAPTVDGDVLVALARTKRPCSGRQVARLVRRGSQPAVNAALDRLVGHGLVHRQSIPPAFVYTLNRDHVGIASIEALARMRSELMRRLRAAFASWSMPAVHASLFGSAARGDGSLGSDVDLFVVRLPRIREGDARWREQLDSLRAAVRSWTGNTASVVELSDREVARFVAANPPVLAELRRDGIDLAGRPLAELLSSPR